MEALEQLKREHRHIELAVRALRGVCRRLETGEPVPAEPLRQFVDFIRTFADGCHHEKEEKHLFPALELRGVPREGGPIGVMLHEHDIGRQLVRTMDTAAARIEAKDEEGAALFAEAGRRYIELLTAHIQKEEQVLFPMAERVLGGRAASELDAAFASVEQQRGSDLHRRYEAMAAALARDWAP